MAPRTCRRRRRTSAPPGGRPSCCPTGRAAAPADAPAEVQQAIWAANRLKELPYKYGGGHAKIEDNGYDCSGTVSYALIHAGLLESPLPSGSFMRWGARGRGAWITVFANGGHAYAVIAGLRLDTSSYSLAPRATSASTPRPSSAARAGARQAPGARVPQAPPRRLLAPSRPANGAARRGRANAGRYACSEDLNRTTKEAAVPGIGGRMSTVIKAKISKMLDRAEDPC